MDRQEYFNTAAATWDKRFQTKELLTVLEHFVPKFNLKLGQRILDVGTGTGTLIPFLLESIGPTGHVTAIDYSEKMVDICKTKLAGFPNVSVIAQQAEKLQFPSESFDAVTCFGVFPHFENKREALSQINRVLKPGGRLIVAHALSRAEIEAHHSGASAVVAHNSLPDNSEMKQLLKQTGFTRIRILDEPDSYLCFSNKTLRETTTVLSLNEPN